jgi:hypothetical protein
MDQAQPTTTPFRFFTRLHLTELTGLRASTLSQLVRLIKTVPDSCIYHHTHRFLQQHQYLSPEPPNDFAYWASEILGDDELGEKLASLDIVGFSDIRGLRTAIERTIAGHLKASPMAKLRFARANEEFHFIKSVSFVLPTNYCASNLREFSDCVRKVTVDSMYFHIFEARLRLEKPTNDFSLWIDTSMHNRKLADRIARMDPYTMTLQDLREKIARAVEEGL